MRLLKSWPVLLLTIVLVACSAPQVAPTAANPTAVEVAAATATKLPAPTAENTPTEAATATEVAATDYCIECHTDKDQLIQTAKVEEEKPKESEGAG